MLPYKNPALSPEERADDLVKRMTLTEKARQMDEYATSDVARSLPGIPRIEVDYSKLAELCSDIGIGAIQLRGGDAKTSNQVQKYIIEHSRLGIPALFVEEGLHCFAVDGATLFPQQICLASTFNPEIAEKTGHAIAAEGKARGFHEIWSPVLDLARDPRWGRTEETYGEDTFLSSSMGTAFVKGVQGEDVSAPDRLMASPKHFSAYGGPQGGLNCMPASYGKHEHEMYALPVFEDAFVEGKAMGTMCSYSSVDGTPCSADRHLLTDILRGRWGMRGYVRSDMCCINMLTKGWNITHKITKSEEDSIRLAIMSGIDMQLYDYPHDFWQNTIISSVEDGSLDEEYVNTAVKRILVAKFTAGLFDNPYVPEDLEEKTYFCESHRETCLQSAREGIVLLKNNGILPLSKNIKKIGLIGPLADKFYPGDYSNIPYGRTVPTVLDELRKAVPDAEILFEEGCRVLDRELEPVPDWWMKTPDGERGLKAEYFNNDALEGEPCITRIDPNINFNWVYYRPDSSLDAGFSVRWTGSMTFGADRKFNIGVSSTDSMRLFIDGVLVADGWDKDANILVPFEFRKGRKYELRIEYKNDGSGNRVIFGWGNEIKPFDDAVKVAEQSDVVIAVVGDSQETCGENLDRCSLDLPGRQLDLLKAVKAAGKPMILVMETGRPVSAYWEDRNMDAIIEAWSCGEFGAQAVTEIIFGDTVPSGKLPITFPRTVGQIPVHYNRISSGGKKYVEMDWRPLYPFGFGLSYTQFEYSDFSLSEDTIKADENVTVSFNITNTGKTSGLETCQVYINDMYSSTVRAIKELKGFRKVFLNPGETKKVEIVLTPKELRTLTPDFRWMVEPGEFEIMVGKSSDDIRFRTVLNVQE